jgi:hypothetical protein
MTVRTVGPGIGAAFAFIVLFGAAAPDVASAGAFKCENWWLYEDDEMALRVAALKVLPRSVHIDDVAPCRNPHSAHAWISTKRGTSKEGIQQWYEFTCRREAQPWKCDQPEVKQLIATTVFVGGVSHPVELSFDKESSLKRAHVLASRAIEVYLDPASQLPSCGVSSLEEGYFLRAQSSLSPLPSGGKAIHVSVSNQAKDSVALDDVNVRIDFRPTADAAGSEAVCWWQVVVVT